MSDEIQPGETAPVEPTPVVSEPVAETPPVQPAPVVEPVAEPAPVVAETPPASEPVSPAPVEPVTDPTSPASGALVDSDEPATPPASPTSREDAAADKQTREQDFAPGVVHGGDGYQINEPEISDVPGPPNGRPDDGVHVTVFNRRSDADLIPGQVVEITDGDHQGRSGPYLFPVEFGDDNYPSKIMVRTDDDDCQQIVVLVSHAKHKTSPR